MARTERRHYDGSLLSAMSCVSAGITVVGLSNSSSSYVTIAVSSSTIEEVPAAVRATHRSPEECIKPETKESCTEISRKRGTSLKGN